MTVRGRLEGIFNSMLNTTVRVELSEYCLDVVRYAAYTLSGQAYVRILPAGRSAVTVEFSPRLSPRLGKGISGLFHAALAEERSRAAILDFNRQLMNSVVAKGLSRAAAGRNGLAPTPGQKKELDSLIAQIEKEAAAGASAEKSGDPLGITKTWEEKNEIENGRKPKSEGRRRSFPGNVAGNKRRVSPHK